MAHGRVKGGRFGKAIGGPHGLAGTRGFHLTQQELDDLFAKFKVGGASCIWIYGLI